MAQKISVSQSLFQVYYLGQVEVDRRLSAAVIPWLIEERKLRPEDMQRVWFTSGPTGIAYVADSGEELMRHTYTSILRCGIGADSISFAYLTISDKTDKCCCHVFQSLDLEEARMILQQMRVHEVDVDSKHNPIMLSDEVIDKLNKSKKQLQKLHKTMSVSAGGSNSGSSSSSIASESVSQLTYCGSMSVDYKKITSLVVDKLVSYLDSSAEEGSSKKRKKRLLKQDRGVRWLSRKRQPDLVKSPKVNAMFRPETPDSLVGDSEQQGAGYDTTDHHHPLAVNGILPRSLSTSGHIPIDIEQRPRATSDVHLSLPSSRGRDMHSHSSFPDIRASSYSESTSSLGGADKERGGLGSSISLHSASGSSLEAGSSAVDLNDTLRATDYPKYSDDEDLEMEGVDEPDGDNLLRDFDELPELQQLNNNPTFVSLGDGVGAEQARQTRDQLSCNIPAKLTVSGMKMTITSCGEEDKGGERGRVLLDVSMEMVPCCSQSQTAQHFIAFLVRQKGTKKYQLHLIKTVSLKSASSILKAFKSAFDQCMLASLPSAVCSSCPVLVLNNLCGSLNKHSGDVQEAQSALHEFLSTLPDTEYASLKKQYHKEPFENEHSQLVRWVSLLILFQQQKQQRHTHSASTSPQGNQGQRKQRPSSAGNKGGRSKVPPKMIVVRSPLATSLDSLVRKSQADNIDSPKQDSKEVPTAKTSSYAKLPHDPLLSPCERSPSPLVLSSSQSSLESKGKKNQSPVRFSISSVFQKPMSPFTKRKLEASRPRTDTGSPGVTSTPIRRGHRRTMSWRQQIFDSVSLESGMERRATLQRSITEPGVPQATLFREEEEDESGGEVSPRHRARRRWQWAIRQQLLLIRMERANQNVLRASEAALKRHHLFYKDPSVDNEGVDSVWSELLQQSNPPSESLLAALKMGVPQKIRFKVWQKILSTCAPKDGSKDPLPSELDRSSYKHFCDTTPSPEFTPIISADLGRTYPTHPYFSVEQEGGQKALYNILCAYSVADKEVGYCQGLSFVAGLILIHAEEEDEAFEMLCQLMYRCDIRKMYASDMFNLQIRLYQLSRLMHDHLPDLHLHLEEHDVTPFLYAAPWFLSLFCSQFPLPFISRVMDFILFEGIAAVFKVCLSLLKYHQKDVMSLHNMEFIADYLKTSLPRSVSTPTTMSEIMHSAYQYPEIATKLQTFETEYLVINEMRTSMTHDTQEVLDLESMNDLLKKNNNELIEQVAFCRAEIVSLNNTVAALQKMLLEQQYRLERLEAVTHITPSPTGDRIILISSPSDGETDNSDPITSETQQTNPLSTQQ